MLELKAYRKYNGEKKIAIMDNSFLSFLEKLGKHGFQIDVFLQDYDLILIPDWVLEEVKDSPFRRDFVQNLINSGFPVFSVSELDYTDFVYQEDGHTVVEDCKGFRTPEYRIKKKLMLWVHGIKIRET